MATPHTRIRSFIINPMLDTSDMRCVGITSPRPDYRWKFLANQGLRNACNEPLVRIKTIVPSYGEQELPQW